MAAKPARHVPAERLTPPETALTSGSMLDVRLPDYPFALSFYVWFRDLDAMGHVNNSVYFTYFEQVRTRYWLSLHSESDYMHLGFIVVHAECDYVSPASLGQSLL